MARPLKQWLYKHRDNPYPTKTEKILLALDGDPVARAQVGEFSKPMYQSVIKKEGGTVGVGLRAAGDASLADDYVSPPKYKSSLLNRYLNDSLRHVMGTNGMMDARKRNHSGSFSSNEYDEELLSPSSSEAEANFIYRTETLEHPSNKYDRSVQKEKRPGKDETYWREINAAMALTNLAQPKNTGSMSTTGTRGTTTSCIIQKSSHIAEIKTVKVPILHKY
ncbi:hypothetical protein DNTS_014892 [Danionella cerebrum]|uniref:KN homeodomain domain-containing protein n=1 Tax=Danionella cerebrum TaxID=2873325 RepID=A0A553RAY8_9TELE|nr:hypothetical protein DNTS_014892 [Danionella translucida]